MIFILMVVIFVLGYIAITLEHFFNIDKAVPALLIAVILWGMYILGGENMVSAEVIEQYGGDLHNFFHKELLGYLGEAAEILFFLMGAMTIVETIDAHKGFEVITKNIKTKSKVKLLWILAFITFFFSAALDNLTTSIVMISLIRKLINNKEERWFFAGIIVIAANAGGAWSPIGDVTTTMLWIGKQVTASNIIKMLFLPSLLCLLVPVTIASFMLKGNFEDVSQEEHSDSDLEIEGKDKMIVFSIGIFSLLFVPVIKLIFHLPPYLGMMFGLSLVWITTTILHTKRYMGYGKKLSITHIIKKVEMSTILFFLGILLAVSSLQSAGHLGLMAFWLKDTLNNIYTINIAIGFLSSIVDNVPLVAASMGMYDITTPETIAHLSGQEWGWFNSFVQDGKFWEFLAYCAGTGGSCLIIGSAAGVAVMGIEKINFFWYLKKISFLALLGYLAGAILYIFLF